MIQKFIPAIEQSAVRTGTLVLQKTYHTPTNGLLSLTRDRQSHFIIVDEMGHVVKKCDAEFNCIFTMGRYGSQVGEFIYPTDVTVDESNCVYVTDRWNHRIQQFNSGGDFVCAWGQYGDAEGQLCEPWGIARLANGDIAVVDRGNARLVVFTPKGRVRGHYGKRGTPVDYYEGERFKRTTHYRRWLRDTYKLNTIENRFYDFQYDVGELEYPEAISVDEEGMIYVTDRAAEHVVIFDQSLCVQTYLKKPLIHEGHFEPNTVFACVYGCFVGEELNSLVYLYQHETCTRFDLTSFNVRVSSIYFDTGSQLLYVTDTWHNTVSIFSIVEIQ